MRRKFSKFYASKEPHSTTIPGSVRVGAVAAIIVLTSVPFVARAQVTAPSVENISNELLSPTQARTVYTNMGVDTRTEGVVAWTTTPPEIKALARSLGAEELTAGQITAEAYRQNVLEWIRNNIEVEFRYGLTKGARGALIDLYGSPFDQAELMVAILREGGLTASFKSGDVTVSAQQFGLWTGLVSSSGPAPAPSVDLFTEFTPQAVSVDAKSACRFLAGGGIPATVNGSTNCDGLAGTLSGSAVVMSHIWVESGGQNLDPSYKMHIVESGIDLPQALGCGTRANSTCGNDSSALLAGSSTEAYGSTGATKVTLAGPSSSAVMSAVTSRGTTLFNHLRATAPAADVTSVVGGHRIAPSNAAATWAFGGISYSAVATWTGKIPDKYRTKFGVSAYQHGGCTFFADELAGRRLGMTGFGNQRAAVIVDTLTPSCAGGSYPAQGSIRLTVDLPYAGSSGTYADRTYDFAMPEPRIWYYTEVDGKGDYFGANEAQHEQSTLGSFPIFIVHGFGAAARSAEGYMSDLMAGSPIPSQTCLPSTQLPSGNLVVSRTCHVGNMPVLAESVRSNTTALGRIVNGVSRTVQTQHSQVGIIYSSRNMGPVYLSTAFQSSWAPMVSSDAVASQRAVGMTGLLLSEIENNSMVSDPTNIDESIGLKPGTTSSGELVIIPPTAMSAFLAAWPMPTGYSAPTQVFETARRSRLQAAANAGYTVILNNQPSVYSGELVYKAGSSARMLWMALKGAQASDPVKSAMTTVEVARGSKDKPRYGSVNLADGSLSFAETPDIVTGAGDFPMSLPLVRFYKGGLSERLITEQTTTITGQGHSTGMPSHTWLYTGPDQNSPARIGGGWTHNYNITARVSYNLDRALGETAALDAAHAIASVVVMNDVAAGMSGLDQLRAQAAIGGFYPKQSVMIQNGAKSELFVRQINGEFLAANGTGKVSVPANYANITYTMGDGSVMTFSASRQRRVWNSCQGAGYPPLYLPTDPIMNIDNWSFPNGIRLNFTYQTRSFWSNVPERLNECNVAVADVLKEVRNNLGRVLTFASSSYSSGIYTTISYGDWPAFAWAPASIPVGYKINTVTDENGRQVSFATDCSTLACSNLTVTRPDGKQWKYAYAPTGASPNPALLVRPGYHMRSWRAPDQQFDRESFVYDDLLRLRSVTDANGILTKIYSGGVTGTELYRPGRLRTASGLRVEVYDHGGSKVRALDELNRVSRTVYDSANRPIREIAPEGNEKLSFYDVRGNLTQTKLKAKPGSGLGDIVSYATFVGGESLFPDQCPVMVTCNKLASETDPLGHISNYSWNATHGGLLSITGPTVAGGQPLTTVGYTTYSSGGISFVLPTSISQKIDAGNTLTTSYSYDSANKFVLKEAIADPGGLTLRTCFRYDAAGNLISKTDPDGAVSACP